MSFNAAYKAWKELNPPKSTREVGEMLGVQYDYNWQEEIERLEFFEEENALLEEQYQRMLDCVNDKSLV